MRKAFRFLPAVFLVGCSGGGGDQLPADSPAAAMAAPLSLADLAGNWSVQALGEMSDSVLTSYTLVATADAMGWTMNFPGRDPIPVQVAVDGDSVIVDAGPFESVLRKGVMVTSHSVGRLENGMLSGNFVGHYANAGADSVLRGRIHGTRAP